MTGGSQPLLARNKVQGELDCGVEVVDSLIIQSKIVLGALPPVLDDHTQYTIEITRENAGLACIVATVEVSTLTIDVGWGIRSLRADIPNPLQVKLMLTSKVSVFPFDPHPAQLPPQLACIISSQQELYLAHPESFGAKVVKMLPIKIPPPKAFEGDRDYERVVTWLREVENLFRAMAVEENQKVQTAAGLLGGDALTWWAEYIKD